MIKMASKLKFLRINISRLYHSSMSLQRRTSPAFHFKLPLTKNKPSAMYNLVEHKENNLEDKLYDARNILGDEKYNEIALEVCSKLIQLKNIAVIQPWTKWGQTKRRNTTATLQLEEACALVSSLPMVKIVYQESVSILGEKFLIFGSGTLKRLKEELFRHKALAIFISKDNLKPAQIRKLEDELEVKVFDRYAVVLEIFSYYSRTSESRLQIALAELSVVRSWTEDRHKLILDKREANLKKMIQKLSRRRELVRDQRRQNQLPTISIVGYTNCGKTTLIRALSGDKKIEGEDRLFATLDVTAHCCLLPCGLEVALIDTVGFIQDIPTTLISSFKATLQDAINADVVVHVRDISHPDVISQSQTVQATLRTMPIPESVPLITVNNKCDLLKQTETEERVSQLNISALTGQGLYDLIIKMEKEILRVTGRKIYNMRLLTGSRSISKLRKFSHFISEEPDEDDQQYSKIKVVLTNAEFSSFKKDL